MHECVQGLRRGDSLGYMRIEALIWHSLGMLWRLEVEGQLMRIKREWEVISQHIIYIQEMS